MYAIAVSSLAAAVLPVSALGASYYEQAQEKIREVRGTLQERRGEVQKKIEGKKLEIQNGRKDMMDDMAQKRAEMRRETEKKREEFRAAFDARTQALKKKFGEVRALRIEQFFTGMTEKIENALDRMSGFADRIERAINVPSQAGKDVTKLKTDLAAARAKIHDATTALESAKIKYAELAKNPDPQKAFADVRALIQTTAQAAKDAHASLMDVVTELKGMRSGASAASSTPVASSSSAGVPAQ